MPLHGRRMVLVVDGALRGRYGSRASVQNRRQHWFSATVRATFDLDAPVHTDAKA